MTGVQTCALPIFRLALSILLALLAIGGNTSVVHAQELTTLHHFFGPKNGLHPLAALIRGNDGALYGTTSMGGPNQAGTLFRVSPDGSRFTTLYAFHGNDGDSPLASVIQGKDGALYGTTKGGGVYNVGTVFKVNPDGSGFQSLHAFHGNDGNAPVASVLQDKNGTLYGTTSQGGTTSDGNATSGGTVFRMNPDGSGFQTLHAFTGSSDDGYDPTAAVIQGQDGALYGTTHEGGGNGLGSVFKINPDGTGFQTVHSFSNSEGVHPQAAVLQGQDGALYGTTREGGPDSGGIVFRINPDGTGFQTLHTFKTFFGDGTDPVGAVIQDTNGTLYGTTRGSFYTAGTVYKLNPDGTGFQTLHSFTGYTNENTIAALLQGPDGTFYGTTSHGGVNNVGTLFRLKPDGTGYQSIHDFNYYGSDGSAPHTALIQSQDGFLYGTATQGGVNNVGILFRLKPDGTGYQITHTFSTDDNGGAYPQAALLQTADGALYGTTYLGGLYDGGAVFKINPDGSGFQIVHSFNSASGEGYYPVAGLMQGKDGALYGTTISGGTNGSGTIFRVNTDGTGFLVLYSFNNRNNGAYSPQATLLQGKDGALYGTTSAGGQAGAGVVYRINPDGTGFQFLHTFTGSDGSGPAAAVIQGTDGALYGTTTNGGTANLGTVYRLNTDGTGYQILHNLNTSDGCFPLAALVQSTDGALYGAAQSGGFDLSGFGGGGTLFRVNPDGTGFNILHIFNFSDSEGNYPVAALIQGKDGAFYSTTRSDNLTGMGTVFRLSFTSLLASVSVAPNPARGGQQNPVGTLTLSSAAPTGGILVSLSSANTGAATVPASVTVPAGKTKATFTVTTKKVSANVTTRITATYNDARQSTVLTVTPQTPQGPTLVSLSVSPNPAQGGQQNPTGTVTLSSPVPSGTTAVVSLSSANTGAATVPALVTIPAGATSATFTITTKKVPSNVTTRLTATFNGSTQSTVLTVTH